MPSFHRRDFLKLAALFTPTLAVSHLIANTARLTQNDQGSDTPNIIILLFDAMTARNLSLYGYRRKTTPNFERFAEHAMVYHAHDSAANFTIPGTSSLLTGLYPWTHRAINDGGQIERNQLDHNIFKLIGEKYTRVAFAQNIWADLILTQFRKDIDFLLPPASFGVTDHIMGDKFKDMNLAYRALDDFLFKTDSPGSLVLSSVEKVLFSRMVAQKSTNDYPKGLPGDVNYPIKYRLDDLFDGLGSLVRQLKSPYFAYLHVFSPHAPYRPSKEFYGKFNDNWRPAPKPVHRLSDHRTNADLNDARRTYDEYIATVDHEFGRFADGLQAAGVFENSYVIVTSDHGEMFERGEKNHETPLLFDPVIHIPLMISAPGQQKREDVYSPTNSVDLLPTLLGMTGNPIPAWCEGKLLPGFGGQGDDSRPTFSVEAKRNPAFSPIRIGTVAMRKGKYKMIYYTGYDKDDSFELYDLENDVEELTDLYPSQPAIASLMREELLAKLADANMRLSK